MGLIIVVFHTIMHPLLSLSIYWDNLWKSQVKCLSFSKANPWILATMSPLFSRLHFIHLPMCPSPFKKILCHLTVLKQSSFAEEKIFCMAVFSLKRWGDVTALEMQNNYAAISWNSSLSGDSLTFPDGLSHLSVSIW